MALNHFASQIKETQQKQVASNLTADSQQPTQSRLSKLEAMKIEKAQQKVAAQSEIKLSKEKPAKPSAGKTAENAINSEDHINPALKEIPLTWSDQQMLCALSAMQIRYGRANEAIPYLMMIRKINPKNVECSRLLALAFMRLERWAEAETMVEEYDYLQKANSNGPLDGIVLLYRSLVSFKTNKIAEAKSWFGKFRSFNKVS